VRRHAKASSAGSTEGNGNNRVLRRRAFVTRGAFDDSKGSGARSGRHVQGLLTTLALAIFALALTAAPALATPKATTPVLSSPSYDEVHVEAEADVGGYGNLIAQYSTDQKHWTTGGSSEFTFEEGLVPFEADLTHLKASTTYFVRVLANSLIGGEGQAVSPEPNPSFTTLPADPPTVVAIDSASPQYTTAEVSGKVNRPATSHYFECNFEYVSDAQFTENQAKSQPGFKGASSIGCDQNPISTAGSPTVSAKLIELAAATKYHLRLSVESAGGSDSKANEFTTLAADPPSVEAVETTEVEYSTAEVSGKVNHPLKSDDVNCGFEYISDAQFNLNLSFEEPGFHNAPQVLCAQNPISTVGSPTVSAKLTGLAPATKYHLRLTVSNAGGSDSKEAATFTTLTAIPPSVLLINSATEVQYTSAKASGEVQRPAAKDPILNANCRFEYVTDKSFSETGFKNPGEAPCEPEGSIEKAGSSPVTANLAGLAPATKYHLRLTVSNAGGSDSKEAATFTTLTPTPPSVVLINSASEVQYSTAKVSGEVNRAAGADPAFNAKCRFEYVTDKSFKATGFKNPGEAECEPEASVEKEGASKANATLQGLHGATVYHLRLTVSNAGGSDSKEAATFTTLTPTPPSISIDDVTTFTATSAHFSGKVNPNGTEPAFEAFWHFQCTPSCGSPGGQTAADGSEHEIAVNTAVEPNTAYQVKLIASNDGGQNETTSKSFKTPALPPLAQTLFASEVKATSATLAAKLNAHNSTTAYQFEYGLDEDYGSFAPDSPASATVDNSNHEVTESLTGLQPEAAYHFRITATNTETDETVTGADRTFTTTPASGPKACPNEEVRAQQSSLNLPDCRAYEQVSPVQKNGFAAGAPGGRLSYAYAMADGSGIFYGSGGPMGAATRGLQEDSVSRRGPEGWSTVATLPAAKNMRLSVFGHQPLGALPSADLSKLFFFSANLNPPDNPEGESGALYLTGLDGSLNWITRPQIPNPEPPPGQIVGAPFWPLGGSPDLSTLYFWGQPTLIPADAARAGNGVWGLYEYSEGQLHSAATLPDGTEPPGGAAPASGGLHLSLEANYSTPEEYGNRVSRDGSTLFFISPDPGRGAPGRTELYVRRSGHSTLVSHASDGSPAPSGVSPVETLSSLFAARNGQNQYAYASPDGSSAIFQSIDALTASAPSDGSVKTYRYDVKTDTVTYLPGVGGATIVAASDDGSRFLFGGDGIKLWDNGAIKTIYSGSLTGGNGFSQIAPARAVASGSAFVFSTSARIPGFNGGGQVQIYRYDVNREKLSCLSCPPDDVTPSGEARLAYQRDGLNEGLIPTRGISADANRVFFDSSDPLVPGDANSVRDVYEWTPSGLSLISSGKGTTDSFYLDSSADGNDVFFATKEGLDSADNDSSSDVYDARVDGGFLKKAVVPCSGEACRSGASALPGVSTAATKSFEGAGNQPQTKPKRSKGHKKKHHKKAHKRAGHKRGGSK
jgi:PKD repeat protein